MPLGPYSDFDACVVAQQDKGHSEESARKICGAIEQRVRPDARHIRIDFVAPIHMDRSRADGILATPDPVTGFLKLDGRLTRVGVFRYRDVEGNEWGELRTEDEVFSPDAMGSFRGAVLTDDHPDSFVSVRNVRNVQVGHVGTDIRRDGQFVVGSIFVTDAQTILAIQQGKAELSCGYSAELVEDSGTCDGCDYSYRQTKIMGNHVAIVDKARGGPQCALIAKKDGAYTTEYTFPSLKGDVREANQPQQEQETMKLSKFITDALAAMKANKVEHATKLIQDAVDAHKSKKLDDATEQAEAILNLLQKALKTGEPMLIEAALSKCAELAQGAPASEEAPPDAPPDAPPMDGDQPVPDDGETPPDDAYDSANELARMRARLDMLETRKDGEAARIDARVKLVTQVQKICPNLDHEGRSDSDLMCAVVLAVNPNIKSRLDAGIKKSGAGYLVACFDEAVALHAARAERSDEIGEAIFEAQFEDADDDPGQALIDYHERRDKLSRAVAR